jgi:peptidoglycan hydrolase-like amidase
VDIKVKLSREENIQYFGSEEVVIDIDRYLLGVVPSEIGNSNISACAA